MFITAIVGTAWMKRASVAMQLASQANSALPRQSQRDKPRVDAHARAIVAGGVEARDAGDAGAPRRSSRT